MKFLLLMKKAFFKIFGKLYNVLMPHRYMNSYVKYLEKLGININGMPNYISSDAYFDSHDYTKITVDNGVVISREVMLLTHDYSIARGFIALNDGEITWDASNTPHFLGDIVIGENSFIGARSSLLPNTYIGKNCIIGACSVVKGVIPDNSIVVGNPAKVVGNTINWAKKHAELKDYLT